MASSRWPKSIENLVAEIVEIAEVPQDENLQKREALRLTHRLVARYPNLAERLVDILSAAVASGLYAPNAANLLSLVGEMLSRRSRTAS
jgi:hypothetical protein